MKKRTYSALLSLSVVLSLLAGCGSSNAEVPTSEDVTSEAEDVISDPEEAASSGIDPADIIDTILQKQGTVCQIYTYDSHFVEIMDRYLPEYLTEEEILAANESSAESAPETTALSDTESSVESAVEPSPESASPESADAAEEPVEGAEPDEDAEDGVTEMTGQIGDITIQWHIVEHDMERYQDVLDEALMNQDAENDDRVDLFMISGELAAKYCDSDADIAKPLSALGITAKDVNDQYEFTKIIGSDEDGIQRASTWQVPCGLFAYRRSIAQEVLGTDNPVQVQNEVSSREKFLQLAEKMAQQNRKILPGDTDAYPVYLAQREEGWVSDLDQLQVDPVMAQWAEDTKTLSENGWHSGAGEIGTDSWKETLNADSSVFGFFLTTEDIADYLLPDTAEDTASASEEDAGEEETGDWAVCKGPSAFYRGGAWLCAAQTTDNEELDAEIIRTLTCSEEVLRQMTEDTGELCNNGTAMESVLTERTELPLQHLLNGQDYLQLYDTAAAELSVVPYGVYDNGISRLFLQSFQAYFNGECDQNTALSEFYQNVMAQYPDLLSS